MHNFISSPKRCEIWWELCRVVLVSHPLSKSSQIPQIFAVLEICFSYWFLDVDKIILQIFSFGNTKLIFAFFTKINFGHFIFPVNKGYRHPTNPTVKAFLEVGCW